MPASRPAAASVECPIRTTPVPPGEPEGDHFVMNDKTKPPPVGWKVPMPRSSSPTPTFNLVAPMRVEKTKPEVRIMVAPPREELSLAEAAERYQLMQVEHLLRIGGYVPDPKDPDNWIEGPTIKRRRRPKGER